MSVVWTNLQIPTALALKPKVLNTAFKTLHDFALKSSVTSFPATLSWNYHSTAIFSPLCCSSNTPRMIPCWSFCLKRCFPDIDRPHFPIHSILCPNVILSEKPFFTSLRKAQRSLLFISVSLPASLSCFIFHHNTCQTFSVSLY